MKAALTCLVLFAAGLLAGPAPARDFCAAPPHARLCADFPEDQKDFSRFFVYRVIDAAAQTPFDMFAWQAFVALNWQDAGRPGPAKESWRGFARKRDVFGAAGPCAGIKGEPGLVIATPLEPDGNPLIDRAGNFIVYETRMNAVAAGYIRTAGLDSEAGRAAAGPVAFPRGSDRAHPASVLVKTAWRILPAPRPGYVNAEGRIAIPAGMAAGGHASCMPAHLGLVGMHIVVKVASGHGDEWIWSTFERRDTAPEAVNAREVNSLYARDLFPGGCLAPASSGQSWLFYAPTGAVNAPPPVAAYWGAAPPYARRADGSRLAPTRLVRCWKIFGPTKATNAAWQARLGASPLARYMLISSQWRGANPGPIFPHGELPRFLSNLTMESYLQTDPTGTCLGCHAGARSSSGAPSDFTFLLGG